MYTTNFVHDFLSQTMIILAGFYAQKCALQRVIEHRLQGTGWVWWSRLGAVLQGTLYAVIFRHDNPCHKVGEELRSGEKERD